MLKRLCAILSLMLQLGCGVALAQGSGAAPDAEQKLVDDYGKFFVNMLRGGNPADLESFVPSTAEVTWSANNTMPQWALDSLPEAAADLDTYLSDIFELSVPQLDEAINYMETKFPVIPVDMLEFRKAEAHELSDKSSLLDFKTHQINVTAAVVYPEYGEIDFLFETRALRTIDRYALMGFEVTFRLHELPNQATDDFANAIVKAVATRDSVFLGQELFPSLQDLVWQLQNRAGDYMKEECEEDPENCGLTDDDLQATLDENQMSEFVSLLDDLDDEGEDDAVASYKLLKYELTDEEVQVLESEHFTIDFEIEYATSGTRDFQMTVGAMQGRDKLYMGSIDGAELYSYESLARMKESRNRRAEQSRNNQQLYRGMSDDETITECPDMLQKARNAVLWNEAENYGAAIEASDAVIACPYSVPVKYMISMYGARGDTYEHIYYQATDPKYRSDGTGLSVPELLKRAVEAHGMAFAIADRYDAEIDGVKERRWRTSLGAETAILYTFADSIITEGNQDEAMPLYVAVADASDWIDLSEPSMRQVRAVSGYYAGNQSLGAENYADAARYLAMTVPVNESLTGLSKADLEAQLYLSADASSSLYFNLGSMYYNDVADFASSAVAPERPELDKASSELDSAEVCFKLALTLDPEMQSASSALSSLSSLRVLLSTF